MTVNLISASALSSLNLAGMDLDTAVMAVQGQRALLQDAQLQNQIREVEQRNQLTARLTDMQAKLNAIKAAFSTDAKPGDKLAPDTKDRKLCEEYAKAAAEAGMPTDPVVVVVTKEKPKGSDQEVEVRTYNPPAKQDVERMLTDLKSKIDALGNSQQMDMIRLQSLSNKRNEAYDLMTNLTKKMQDSRNSIIGNMR